MVDDSDEDDSDYIPESDDEDADDETFEDAVENEGDGEQEINNGKNPWMRYKIESELNGPYWAEDIAGAMIIADTKDMMTNYFQMEASKSTPQYGF